MDVNSRIREVRKALGLTQREFGAKIGLAQGYITNLENARRAVSNKIVKLICSQYNVSEAWLLNGDGDMFVGDVDPRLDHIISTFEILRPEFQDYVLEQVERLLELQRKQGE